jgi:hypothetical protein
MVVSGWIVFITLPCVVVTDHIRRSARRIAAAASEAVLAIEQQQGQQQGRQQQGRQQQQLDWNSMMHMVQEAHEKTVKLGSVLAPAMIVTQAILFTCTIWFAINCIAPRTTIVDDVGTPGAVFNTVLSPTLFLLFAMASAIFALWPLFGPAEVTLACDELVESIRALRSRTLTCTCTANTITNTSTGDSDSDATGSSTATTSSTGGSGGGGGSGGRHRQRLLQPSSLIRIEGICRYAMELNRSQGLGFCLYKRRITPALVTSVLIKSILWMLITFPSLSILALIHSEQQQQQQQQQQQHGTGTDTDTNANADDTSAKIPDLSDPVMVSKVANIAGGGLMIVMLCMAGCGVWRCKRHPNVQDLPLSELEQLQVIELNGFRGLRRLATD